MQLSTVLGLDQFLGRVGWSLPDGSRLKWDEPLAVLKAQQYGELPEGVSVMIVDQGEPAELSKIVDWLEKTSRGSGSSGSSGSGGGGALDIILDDGLHLMRDQQQTLGALWPLVSPGGLYVVEDVHTSKQAGYDVDRGNNDWWTLLSAYEATGEFASSRYMTSAQAAAVASTLAAVRCYILEEGESETCVLEKAAGPPRVVGVQSIAPVTVYRSADLEKGFLERPQSLP